MVQLPTDNLYKFIAIFGLIITLFSVYYPLKMEQDAWLLSFDTEVEVESVNMEVEFMEQKIKDLDEYLESITDRDKRLSVIDDINKVKLETGKRHLKSSREAEKAKVLRDFSRRLFIGAIAGSTVGIVLMVTGFFLWWERVQLLLDEQMMQAITRRVEGESTEE